MTRACSHAKLHVKLDQDLMSSLATVATVRSNKTERGEKVLLKFWVTHRTSAWRFSKKKREKVGACTPTSDMLTCSLLVKWLQWRFLLKVGVNNVFSDQFLGLDFKESLCILIFFFFSFFPLFKISPNFFSCWKCYSTVPPQKQHFKKVKTLLFPGKYS